MCQETAKTGRGKGTKQKSRGYLVFHAADVLLGFLVTDCSS